MGGSDGSDEKGKGWHRSLSLNSFPILVLVLGLELLVLGHQVDKLARKRPVHVCADPRL